MITNSTAIADRKSNLDNITHPEVAPSSVSHKRSRQFVRIAMPAFNEAESLPLLIPRIVQVMKESPWEYDILVIDDGSRDDTLMVIKELSQDYPVRAIPHGVNKGLGAAMITVVTESLKGLSDEDIVVTMDADNTHAPQLISTMVPMVREGRDVVIASRFQTGAQVVGLVWYRVWISQIASWVMRALFGVAGCRDYTCGYRAYRVAKLRETAQHYQSRLIREQGFACMAELLLNVASREAIVGEVPMVLRYDHKKGVSKMRLWSTIQRTLRMIMRHRLGWGR